jgi:pimeloyl-ACP methyl ester carboxylesterase
MKQLERGGARIAYTVSGDGPALLLGHGLLFDGAMWQGVVPALAGWRVINVEVRGHVSSAPAPFGLDDLADDWRAILDEERVDRAVLCGFSMGGMTALRLALASPERVRALALVDASADPEPPWNRVKYRAMCEVVERFGFVELLSPIVARTLFSTVARREQPSLVARSVREIRAKDPHGLVLATRAVIDRAPLHHRLGEIACPTLIVVGEHDRATTPDRSARMARAIHGAELRHVPRAGHMSPLEAPDAVARELRRFLDALPQG